MLGVFPACFVRQYVRLGALVECHHLGTGQCGGDLVLLLGRQRVDALYKQLPSVQSLLASLGQADGMRRGPSPLANGLPAIMKRNSQDFAPVVVI